MVFGAGGLGSCLGALLLDGGHDVTLVARGEHLRAMREQGLRLETTGGSRVVRPHVAATVEEADPAEAVFVTTKTHGLDRAARQLLPLTRQGATVVPLVNGVDAPARLEAAGVEPDRIVAGVAYLTAFREAPGVVRRRGEHGRIVLGARDPRALPRAAALARALHEAGLAAPVAEDIDAELWSKMAVVCGLVAGCGLTRADIGAVRAHRLGRRLLERSVAEVAAVARATGVDFSVEEETRVLTILEAFPADFHPSLMHDVETGRPTEIASLSGTVSRLGRSAGVATPVTDATVCAVELMEARRLGSGNRSETEI